MTTAALIISDFMWVMRFRSPARWVANLLVRLFPEDANAYLGMANYYERSGNLQTALSWYERARRLAPIDAAVCFELANAYERSGDRRSAVTYYENFLRHSSETSAEFRNEVLSRIDRLRRVEH